MRVSEDKDQAFKQGGSRHRSFLPICDCGSKLFSYNVSTDMYDTQISMRCNNKKCTLRTHMRTNTLDRGAFN